MAWEPKSCYSVIGEKTYMGANNPLSGALKGDVLMTESPARRVEEKWGVRMRLIECKNVLQAAAPTNILNKC